MASDVTEWDIRATASERGKREKEECTQFSSCKIKYLQFGFSLHFLCVNNHRFILSHMILREIWDFKRLFIAKTMFEKIL